MHIYESYNDAGISAFNFYIANKKSCSKFLFGLKNWIILSTKKLQMVIVGYLVIMLDRTWIWQLIGFVTGSEINVVIDCYPEETKTRCSGPWKIRISAWMLRIWSWKHTKKTVHLFQASEKTQKRNWTHEYQYFQVVVRFIILSKSF